MTDIPLAEQIAAVRTAAVTASNRMSEALYGKNDAAFLRSHTDALKAALATLESLRKEHGLGKMLGDA